jgi:CDP-4-dehydro-6-deoxyglucose reductase, E3
VTSEDFTVVFEPGGQRIHVAAGQDVLSAALAAGIAIAHSCRAGRCASCKARLLSGDIDYPGGTPPGIAPSEIARGEILLCQAHPRSALTIEARRIPVRAARAANAELVAVERLPLGALGLRLRYIDQHLELRPGQFADVRNHAGDAERLPVIGVHPGVLELEAPADTGALFRWLEEHATMGTVLRISGPFDQLR